MRRAMQVLFVLAIPGLVFGFLLQVPPVVFEPLEFSFWVEDTSLAELVLALVLVPPGLLVAYVIYVVIDWLSSGSRPDRRARP